MKIVFKPSFIKKLGNQIDNIAQHNPSVARKFKEGLFIELKKTVINPYICRQSIFFDDPSIRDLIYKKHIIVFRINSNQLEVFGLVYYQKSP